MEVEVEVKMGDEDGNFLENRPGVFFLGSSNVGKRTLLSRMFFLSFFFFIIIQERLLMIVYIMNSIQFNSSLLSPIQF